MNCLIIYGEKISKIEDILPTPFYSDLQYPIFMKTAIIRKDYEENRKIELENVEKPIPGYKEVLTRIIYCGVTSFDYQMLSGAYEFEAKAIIPGIEMVGFVEKVGADVHKVKKGDYIVIYPWVFCEECDMCLSKRENYCRNKNIIGKDVNGCYAEYLVAPEKNVFKISRIINPELAATLSYDALTAYHAVNNLNIKIGDPVAVFGASSDIGLYLVQLIKLRGGYVIGVSKDEWIIEYGVDLLLPLSKIEKYVRKNNIHIKYVVDIGTDNLLDIGLNILDINGIYYILDNTLKKRRVMLDLNILFDRGIILMGSLGGTVNEFIQVIKLAEKKLIKPKIWRIYPLTHVQDALHALPSEDKKGKILLRI